VNGANDAFVVEEEKKEDHPTKFRDVKTDVLDIAQVANSSKNEIIYENVDAPL